MAQKDLIISEKDGTLTFGDYTLEEKTKVKDFKYKGDLLYVKSYKTTTKLEKNDLFVYESEPGTRVSHMKYTDSSLEFQVEGTGNTTHWAECSEENARKDNSDNDGLKSDDEKLVDLFRDFIE